MSGEQKVQRRNIQAANMSFGYVTKFKFLGTTLTNQNFMQEAIQNRLNLGNACNRGVRTSFCYPKIQRYIRINLAASCGCESCSVTLTEQCRLTEFEKRGLKKVFGPKTEEGRGKWRQDEAAQWRAS